MRHSRYAAAAGRCRWPAPHAPWPSTSSTGPIRMKKQRRRLALANLIGTAILPRAAVMVVESRDSRCEGNHDATFSDEADVPAGCGSKPAAWTVPQCHRNDASRGNGVSTDLAHVRLRPGGHGAPGAVHAGDYARPGAV